jgi:DNA mismatch repair ATPase MutS
VKEAALALHGSKNVFVVFDELFKGTNVKDAFDGSLLIINELVKWKSGFFILSSHLLELGREIDSLNAVRFMCFDSSVENGKPLFNFKLKEGLSDERLGLVILKNEQVFELLNPEFQIDRNEQS